MNERRWQITEENRALTGELSGALGISRIAAHILVSRGVTTAAQAQTFLTPHPKNLAPPMALSGMERAVDRIRLARERREMVRVFGDYDVDGIAGTAIMLLALQRFGLERVDYGMPSRLVEGYGIGVEHVEDAHASGVSVLITVDNGVNARAAASRAKELGVDLIVTDHHSIEGELPDCYCVVNPKQESAGFPGREMSGAAVAMKLAWALTGELDDLDLAALGTIADIVPLQDENRTIAALGVADMAKRRRIGLVQLASVAGLDLSEVTAEKIAFQLAPRMNAAGRLGEGLLPLKLLLSQDPRDAARMADALNKANEERRRIEADIFEQAVEALESEPRDRSAIVLARQGWHPGVIGIVASRLYARYAKPVVLIGTDESGLGRSSARCGEAFDMVGALSACQRHLVRFGGHMAAAGLTIEMASIPAFVRDFEAEAARRTVNGAENGTVKIDSLISLSEIEPRLVRELDRLEPFGCMNPAPVFCTFGVTVVPGSPRELRGGHLKFTVQEGPRMFPAIAFSMADALEPGLLDGPVDLAFTPRFNTFRGETTIQLLTKELRSARP